MCYYNQLNNYNNNNYQYKNHRDYILIFIRIYLKITM